MHPGVEETDNSKDVVELLLADHQWFSQAFAELRHTHEVQARRVKFESIARELARHETAEEQAVYPVLAQLGDEGRHLRESMLAEERYGNKLIARALRISLLRAGGRPFRHLLDEIADLVGEHAAHEESSVFPLLRRTQEQAKLEMMAGWVSNVKALGPTRPHPHAPRNAAGLLLTTPAVAMMDRMRDVGRRLLQR